MNFFCNVSEKGDNILLSIPLFAQLFFLLLAFGKQKNTNTQDSIDLSLRFNDQYTGIKRINHTTNLLHTPNNIGDLRDLIQCRDDQESFFDKLHLKVENKPYTLNATCKFDRLLSTGIFLVISHTFCL